MARFDQDSVQRILRQTRQGERRLLNPQTVQRPAGKPKRFRRRLFELKTSLLPGGSATAYLRLPNRVTGDIESTAVTFTVVDDIGDREGTGRDDAGSGGVGALGKSEKWPGGPDWLVYDLQCP